MTQPAPGPPPDVIGGDGHGPGGHRRSGWLVLGGALLVLLAITRLTAADHPRDAPRPRRPAAAGPAAPAPLSTRTTAQGTFGAPLAAVPGTAVAVAIGRHGLYVAQADPPRVLRIVRATRVAAIAPAPARPAGVAVDDAARVVWVWSTAGQAARPRTDVRGYDARTLQPLTWTALPDRIRVAAAFGPALWLGGDAGLTALYRTGAVTHVGEPRPGGSVGAVAPDFAHGRLLAWTDAGVLVTVVSGRFRSLTRLPSGIGATSLAPVGPNLWAGTFGQRPAVRHVLAAAPATRLPTGPAGAAATVGAVVWPGEDVVWLRDGGSEELSCVDPATGAVLEEWSGAPGPVVSRHGTAYAVNGGTVVRLGLTRDCTG